MSDFAWFWLTVIVAIIAICVHSTLGDYFKYKYGKENKDE